MPYAARQVPELTPAVRVALASACAYFVTTVTASAAITATILLTDWPLAHDYGHSVMFFSALACMLWYPMMQLIAFRAPGHLWNAIGVLLVLNLILASMFLTAAAGMVFQSALMSFVAVGLAFEQSRRRKPEIERLQ